MLCTYWDNAASIHESSWSWREYMPTNGAPDPPTYITKGLALWEKWEKSFLILPKNSVWTVAGGFVGSKSKRAEPGKDLLKLVWLDVVEAALGAERVLRVRLAALSEILICLVCFHAAGAFMTDFIFWWSTMILTGQVTFIISLSVQDMIKQSLYGSTFLVFHLLQREEATREPSQRKPRLTDHSPSLHTHHGKFLIEQVSCL